MVLFDQTEFPYELNKMHSDIEDDFFHLSGLNFLQKKSKNSKIYGMIDMKYFNELGSIELKKKSKI